MLYDIIYNDNNEEVKCISYNSNNSDNESDPPSPYIQCGRNPKVMYVNDDDDMEDIEIKTKCLEDTEINDLEGKISRGLWGEFKKGYLSLDLRSVN